MRANHKMFMMEDGWHYQMCETAGRIGWHSPNSDSYNVLSRNAGSPECPCDCHLSIFRVSPSKMRKRLQKSRLDSLPIKR